MKQDLNNQSALSSSHQSSSLGTSSLRTNSYSYDTMRAERKKAEVTQEVVDYLLANNGPDNNGRAHPTQLRIHFSVLEDAIVSARKGGMQGDWKPYHFAGHYGTFTNSVYLEELVYKAGLVILGSKNNNLGNFIGQATKADWEQPVVFELNGRRIEVNTDSVTPKFGRSPYELTKVFLSVHRGTDPSVTELLKELRPWHMARAAANSYNDPLIVTEVLLAKGSALLSSKKGNIDRFLNEVELKDWHSDLTVLVAGHVVEVSMSRLCFKFDNSPYKMTRAFFSLCGNHDLVKTLRTSR